MCWNEHKLLVKIYKLDLNNSFLNVLYDKATSKHYGGLESLVICTSHIFRQIMRTHLS